MCCPLDQVNGKLIIEEVDAEKEPIIHLHGFYDQTPETLNDRIFRTFQRLELVEKNC